LKAARRDLAALKKRSPELATGARAEAVLALARRIDDRETSATACSLCAHEMDSLLRRLEAMAPADQRRDRVDEINERRRARRETQKRAAAK
jgi:hypothetical protein